MAAARTDAWTGQIGAMPPGDHGIGMRGAQRFSDKRVP